MVEDRAALVEDRDDSVEEGGEPVKAQDGVVEACIGDDTVVVILVAWKLICIIGAEI